MPVTITPQQFVHKWRDVTLKKRSASQEHFIDLGHLVSHPTPAEYDPTGERFTFERGTGTQLRDAESGFRYSQTMTFETFPMPWPPGQEPNDDPRVAAIATAIREQVEKRDAWLHPPGAGEGELKKRTLTNLYNQRPTWLDLAHKKLDTAVIAAYGWPNDLTDEQILERLLALNLARAGEGK